MAQRPPVRPKEPEPGNAKETPPSPAPAPASAPKNSSTDAQGGSGEKAAGTVDKSGAAGKDAAKDSETREREAKEKESRDREKRQLRAQNLAPKRPDAAFLKTLVADIKRNTAFIRKLKLGAYNEAILTEFAGLNISRYVSEAVVNVAEAPLKMADVPLAVRLISAIHQRYAEFASALLPALVKHFAPGTSIR